MASKISVIDVALFPISRWLLIQTTSASTHYNIPFKTTIDQWHDMITRNTKNSIQLECETASTKFFIVQWAHLKELYCCIWWLFNLVPHLPIQHNFCVFISCILWKRHIHNPVGFFQFHFWPHFSTTFQHLRPFHSPGRKHSNRATTASPGCPVLIWSEKGKLNLTNFLWKLSQHYYCNCQLVQMTIVFTHTFFTTQQISQKLK